MDNKEQLEIINAFAKTNFRNREVGFGIKTDDRRRHMYIIGKTGMGKSTMLENMIAQDIQAGNGIAFVDPHGGSVETILNYIPSSRVNDIIYFNPADSDYPIAFNPLEAVDPKYKHLVASGLMGVFTKIWENVWSARMEYILNNTILALLDTPGNTMLGIARMLVDKKFRQRIVANIKDPVVRSFWIDEFANYTDKFRQEAIAPIQNKVGQFLSSPIIRNIVGQTKSTIDLREIMDNRKILLLNLSKGRIGEDNSALLGAMFITKLQLAAMSRVDIPEEERKDFYLFVDEFQNFATESFATILSEARKYRLSLIVAHQYIEQLDEKVQAAIFGNVGTMIAFRIGATDAEALESEFEPAVTPNDLVNLTKYHIYLKLMINGVSSKPFSAVTLPPLVQATGNQDKVIKVSRERYGNWRTDIEEKITRWMGQEYHQEAAKQNLTDEEEEGARGGVIFGSSQEAAAPPAQPAGAAPTVPIAPKIAEKPVIPQVKRPQPREKAGPSPAPPQAEVKPNEASKPTTSIWDKISSENEKKNEEMVKKISKSLVFKFGDRKKEPESPRHEKQPEPVPKPPVATASQLLETPSKPVPSQKPDTLAPASTGILKPGERIKF